MSAAHEDPAYRRNARDLKALQLQPCCICHGRRGPIDYTDRTKGPLSFTAQHLTAAALGGRPDQLAPAHRVCNEEDGGRLGHQLRTIQPVKRSASWPNPAERGDPEPLSRTRNGGSEPRLIEGMRSDGGAGTGGTSSHLDSRRNPPAHATRAVLQIGHLVESVVS